MASRAALGAGAIGLALLGAGTAHADCAANQRYNFSFASRPAATLNYGSSYNYTATNGLGASQNLTMALAQNGLSSTEVNNQDLPNISTLINDGSGRSLVLGGIFGGRTSDIFSNTRTIRATFTFATPIRDFTMTVHDIDYAHDQYRDWFAVVGRNGSGNYVASMTTPFGTANGSGDHSDNDSALRFGPETTPYDIDARAAVGTGASDNNGNDGNITLSFVEPVTSVEIRYGNYPYSGWGDNSTGQQGVGIDGLSFCPMPQLTVVKSSTPYVTAGGDPNRFNIPGADVIYAITLANTGGSAAELNGVVLTDILPANMTYYNGDFDGAGPVVGPFDIAFGGGTTASTGSVEFSNNGGSSYGYIPGAGYDAAVDAIRMSAVGTVPPGGSATVRFRARID
ncbi:DUF11 domain-containing protein [Sphingomonas gilva]|uniref:DUF11 domain-containing protein n=1 Tax=Sphingomonas gilva TaxID=2305907 RepID=A0A396RNR7_9SPHN|nr:DUF11 domain-containing protein [Sphingomonas gilva]RHW18157.1 DUF11 domain-containing protein [Sphingomonas gilva]